MNIPLDIPSSGVMREPLSSPASEGAMAAAMGKAGGLPFDAWRLLSALLRRWPMVVVAGVAAAGVAGVIGSFYFATRYTAAAQLMRQESAATFRASELGEAFKPRQLTVPTLVSFMKSPVVLQRVAEQSKLPARSISHGLTISPERNTDLIHLSFASTRSAQTAARVLNAFGNEVVRLTRDMQSQEAAEMNRLLKRQLVKAEEDLRKVNRELLDFSKQAGLINVDKELDAYLRSLGELDMRYETTRIEFEALDLKIAALERELAANNPLADRLQLAREKYQDLLQHYTEANPLVEEQRAAVKELEVRLKEAEAKPIAPPRQGESGLAASFYADLLNLKTQKKVAALQIEKLKVVRADVEEKLRGLPEKGLQLVRIKARQQSLETAQSLLASRQREAQLYEESSLGYYRFFESKPDEVDTEGRGKKVLLVSVAGGVLGIVFSVLLVCLVEAFDERIKTVADLKRVTQLPLLATLPPLDTMDAVAQSSWGFRTWLAMQAKLATGTHGQLLCGFVSETRGEGCSTWLELLGRAASQRHQTVLTVTNRAPIHGVSLPLDVALANPDAVPLSPTRPVWLVFPPDWRWTVERRFQWSAAVETWSKIQDFVALVELNSSEEPEWLLFAEELPQLVWIATSGKASQRSTAERLQNFLNAGCTFAGAVLNREIKHLPWL